MIHLTHAVTAFCMALALPPAQACPEQLAPPVAPLNAGSGPQLDTRPLPEISTLMQQVEANQITSESILRTYIYTSTLISEELDGHGNAKKTETLEREVFYIADIRLERTTRKNGRDLTAEEQRKESDRIDKAIAKAKQKQAGKAESAMEDRQTVTFARFLELGSFSNERRILLRGRNTIALDYVGDPKAKTHNALEGVIHDLAGVVWVDEQDRALSRVEGHFLDGFKVAGGLIFSVAKNTAFTADWSRVNNEVWLPSTFSANGSLRALLFVSFNGRVSGSTRNYRRFKAIVTILPGMREVDPEIDPPTQLTLPQTPQE